MGTSRWLNGGISHSTDGSFAKLEFPQHLERAFGVAVQAQPVC
jgi:hypothetical protein